MTVTSSPTFGSLGTAVTITLASLATSTTDVGRVSDVIDITSIDCIDLWIGGKITTGTTPTVNKQIEVWLAASYDGTSYQGGATGGGDAALTATTKVLMRLAAMIPVTATSNVTHTWGVSVAECFGGSLPPKFVVFVTHSCVAALNATPANHELKYTPINFSSV